MEVSAAKSDRLMLTRGPVESPLDPMPFQPSEHTLADLRQRFEEARHPPSRPILRLLLSDPRAGVRALGEVLRRRRSALERRRRDLTRRLEVETALRRGGLSFIAGVDEAGVGPLAGPVVAAAVIFPPELVPRGRLCEVDDSKRLPREVREALAEEIRGAALAVGIGSASVEEIDHLNIYHAGLLAMRRAVDALSPEPEHLLIDARRLPELAIPQSPIIGGDSLCFSIAAASILAKTHRDALLVELDHLYPAYGFAGHKGYPTPSHKAAVRRHGPCPAHRRSYALIREMLEEDLPLFKGM